MRDFSSMEFRPSLIGTLSTIGGTAVGAPINVLGFKAGLGLLSAGGVQGSSGSTVTLSVKFQESSVPAGTGANWTDITNEAVSGGSFAFSAITMGDELAGGTTTGTWLPYESVRKFGRLSDGNRKQWLRAHATLTGTVGIGPKFVAGILLARPDDTYYVQSAVVVPSGNVESAKLL